MRIERVAGITRAAPAPITRPGNDEVTRGGSQGRESRRNSEGDQPCNQGSLAPEAIPESTAGEQQSGEHESVCWPQFVQTGELEEVPRYRLPKGELSPATAYQIIHDELMLDGNARLNLATFVTTWMEPEAERLMSECADKNMIDKDEYPQTAELEMRCISMLANLWGASDGQRATGCSTIGSSEACMLGGLALLRRWRERDKVEGQTAARPNLVMGANVQVCWDKFCRYWDVEPRQVPLSEGRTHLTANVAAAACDENTIGVVAILGSTFDGSYEPVQEIAVALDGLADERGIDVPIYVDAASGGFVAPFLDPTCCGISGSPECSRSMPPATSTGWSIPGWAGLCGATRLRCPTTLSSMSITWVATCPPLP